MNRFLIILVSIFTVTSILAKSPHGDKLKIDCAVCHNTNNWKQWNSKGFNHNKTNFPLVGQHKTVECRKCHPTLEFSNAKKQCNECHIDIHQGTVGNNCERCHTPKTWIISNVKQIHQQIGFVLDGAHATADCYRCHKSASLLRFDPIKTDCYSCHKANYDATTKPNHLIAGFDKDCFRCHNMTGKNWSISGNGFEHGLFPLTGGHKIDCNRCHTTGEYLTKISTACVNCHLGTYNSTTNPNHVTANFPKTCEVCHTTNNWTTSTYNHSTFFPITSGNHNLSCTTCHTNPANFAVFTCITSSCHGNAHHHDKGSTGCYSCHPTGRAGD